MSTATDAPHTTRAIYHVALAEFLRVPCSEVKPLTDWPNLFQCDGLNYAVSDKTDQLDVENVEFIGRCLGCNIWRVK